MKRASRIILGAAVVIVVLRAADLATRDCRLAPYVYDNCLWVALRAHLGLLPDSRFLRMGVLEGVGILLALVLYLIFRYVLPQRKASSPASDLSSPSDPARAGN